MKPFNVRRPVVGGWWYAHHQRSGRVHGPFGTQAEAIDFCYKTWPWWP